MNIKKIDKIFLALSAILVFVGFFVFTSASFGLFVRKGFFLGDILFNQAFLGIFLGALALIASLYIPLKSIRPYSLYIFIGSVLMTLLVFIPGIGFAHGGAHRWILLGPISFQPSEILKLGTVIYCAALLPIFKDRLSSFKYSFGFLALITLIPAIVLLLEPDTGTLMVLVMAVSAMLIAGGMKLKHFLILILISCIAIVVLAVARPYIKERLLTFVDPSRDPQGASYQIQKSLLAIGSGGITGRGFGQSIQKFGSLPEPTGDSIFAVVGEEFGFVGGVTIIVIFFLFGLRGLHIANVAGDAFSGLLAVGIVILIVAQSFMNIAAMLGLIPLTGVPLVFISHGGTAIFFALLEIGILLNISSNAIVPGKQKKR